MPTQTPHLIQEFQAQIEQAHADGTCLRIHGGDNKRFLRSTQSPPGLLDADSAKPIRTLDCSPLHGIVEYEPSELMLSAWAGTALADIESLLAAHGQHLPFDPPHFTHKAGPYKPENSMPSAPGKPGNFAAATLGGAVASALSGPARASLGSARDYVLGLQMLDGKGQLLNFGGQVMKNVAGYDVSRLMVGSWGRLGLLCKINIKVLPCAPAQTTLCLPMQEAVALQQMQRWCNQALPLNASLWTDAPDLVPAVHSLGPAALARFAQGVLCLRLRGAQAAVTSASDAIVSECHGAQVLDEAAAAQLWQDCREQQLGYFTPPSAAHLLLRLCLPPTAPPFQQSAGASLPSPLIEWHGGQRWVWAPQDQALNLHAWAHSVQGWARPFRLPADPAYQPAPSSALLRPQLATSTERIVQQLQNTFDPNRVFA